ncbi:MAG: heat-inducible transcription repressor HrcA [Candidatus Omnitrophica bacterium CG1_02_49_10]|nr:MAG: heat-inducible transcription repressor HrcA [Candidatus Omnitrophica bacterium CG1_02_49_10]
MNVTYYDTRRKNILSAIINLYLETGQPVSSRGICRRFRFGLSPATIRNVMADLEDTGYLTHTHISAGRVPTDIGYRYYVDYIMHPQRMSDEEERAIEEEYLMDTSEIEEVFRKTSRVLSAVTDCAGLILIPGFERWVLGRVEIISVSPRRAMLILVTDSGIVKSSFFNLDADSSERELGMIASFLNSELKGMSISEIKDFIERKMLAERSSLHFIFKKALDIMESAVPHDEGHVYLDGIPNILDKMDLGEVEQMRRILKIIDDKSKFIKIMNRAIEWEGVKVHIGAENEDEEINIFSLISSSYRVKGRPAGSIAVLGPKRLNYAKAVYMVKYMSDKLSDIMTGLSR